MNTPTKFHIKEADGIRGIACLIVLVVHTIAITFPSTYPYLQGTGKIGVWLFFCLSSFLLTCQLLLRGLSKVTIVDYFVGRTLRIYPLFAVSVFAYYVFGTANINTTHDIVSALTFQRGYAHLWTIAVEFKFYFFLPAFVLFGTFIQSRFGIKSLLAMAALLTLIHQIYAPYWLLEENTIDTFQYLPAFFFGTIAAFASVNKSECRILYRTNLVGIMVLIGILASTPFVRYFILGLPPSDYLMNKYLYFSLGWTVFIFTQTQSHSRGILEYVLTSRPLRYIGLYSYSIYLIHWLILLKITARYPENFVAAAAVISMSIGAGYFLYSFFEKPLFATRKHLMTSINHVWLNSAA